MPHVHTATPWPQADCTGCRARLALGHSPLSVYKPLNNGVQSTEQGNAGGARAPPRAPETSVGTGSPDRPMIPRSRAARDLPPEPGGRRVPRTRDVCSSEPDSTLQRAELVLSRICDFLGPAAPQAGQRPARGVSRPRPLRLPQLRSSCSHFMPS